MRVVSRCGVLGVVASVACFAGCDRRPQAIVVCHNANCAHATNPANDDTLAALDDSLALRYLERPPFDGMELDSLWDHAGQRCAFAHDFSQVGLASDAEAADRVAAYLAQPTDFVSWSGSRFFVKVEFKPEVNAAGDPHSPQDVQDHYACLLDMYDRIVSAAVANERELEFAFESTPALARGLVDYPGWPGKEPQPGVHVRLIANASEGGLLPSDLPSLQGDTDADGLDILSYHASRIPDGPQQAYIALRARIMLWMLDAALEEYYSLEDYDPEYVVSNEAVVMRRWMEE